MLQNEDYLKLRNNLINAPLGSLLLDFLQDFITNEACKQSRNAENIKGMCELVQQIKKIPQIVENLKKQQ